MLFITQEEEIQMNIPVQALYFYASWMPFHSKFIRMIDRTEEKHKEILFSAIDVDQFSSQCKRFTIDSIPTVIILKNGREINRIGGLVLTDPFEHVFADICDH